MQSFRTEQELQDKAHLITLVQILHEKGILTDEDLADYSLSELMLLAFVRTRTIKKGECGQRIKSTSDVLIGLGAYLSGHITLDELKIKIDRDPAVARIWPSIYKTLTGATLPRSIHDLH